MAAISWPAAHTAVVTWIKAALADVSGLQVVWAYQPGVTYPEPPVVVPFFGALAPIERGSEVQTFDEDADAGEEFTTTLTRHWETTLGIALSTTAANVTGSASPHALVARLLTHLKLPSTLAALQAAGLGFRDEGEIDLEPPPLFKNVWQPTAIFSIRFRLTTSVTESTGYFETAQVAAEVDGDSLGTVSIPLEEATP